MKLKEGAAAEFEVSFGPEAMRQFQAVSGDDNPIHWDAAFAGKRGFDGPVVYGGLIVASISRLLGRELPGPGCVWHSLTIEFVKPLYVNRAARVAGEITYVNDDLRVFQMKIEVFSGGVLIARGKAQGNFS